MKRLIILLSLLTISYNKEKLYCDIKGYVNKPGVYEINENNTIHDVIKLAGGLKKGSYTDNINLSKKVQDEMVIYIYDKEYIEKLKELNNCNCYPKYKYIECEQMTTKITSEPIKTTKVTIPSNITNKEVVNKTTIKNATTKVFEKYSNSSKKTTTNKIITTKKETTTSNKLTTECISTTTKVFEIININTANIEELCTLKGLGEKKASTIIEYRENNGLFNSIEEIMNVSGIGESTFEKIKEFIKV